MHKLYSLAIVMLVSLICTTASGQIQLGTPSYFLSDHVDASSAYRTSSAISSVALVPTTNGLQVKGDISLHYDPALGPQTDGYHQTFLLGVSQPFSVGPLPVSIHGSLNENLELVLGNGTTTVPTAIASSGVIFYLHDASAPNGVYDFPTADFTSINTFNNPLVGNGHTVFSPSTSGSDFVFGAGYNQYEMYYYLTVSINNAGLAAIDPPPVLTVEFGGTSEFSGINFAPVAVLLPEPGTFVLAAFGSVALVACGWHKRHRAKFMA